MNRRALLLALITASLLMAAGWRSSFLLADWIIFGPPVVEEVELVPVEPMGEIVREASVAAGLEDAELLEQAEEEREDDQGTWTAQRSSWRLPAGQEADESARRIKQLVEEMSEGVRVYVTSQNDLESDVRVYAGKRLTHHLRLTPTLSDAPLPAAGGAPPLISIVVSGLGHDGALGQSILSGETPLTAAIVPFSPFALRQAREAALRHKEILIELRADQDLREALEAVPYASGLLLVEPPRTLDLELLEDHGLYLLDATAQQESAALRTARNAGVPVVRAGSLMDEDPVQGLKRARHLAATQGSVIVVVGADEPSREIAMGWLEGRERIRAAFVTEVLDSLP